MASRETDERGQVLSSFTAVAAAVAIVVGLLVLFGTRGDDTAADPQQPKAGTSTQRPSASGTIPAPPTSPPSSRPPATPSRPSSAPTLAATPTSSGTSRPIRIPTLIPVAELPAVEVYNNTNRRGLAEQVANKARAVGWKVAGADNWYGKIVASTVYYPAGMQAEATQLAKVLGISRVKDALPNMKMDRLSVILTEDYSG
jgi:hypothetical protein